MRLFRSKESLEFGPLARNKQIMGLADTASELGRQIHEPDPGRFGKPGVFAASWDSFPTVRPYPPINSLFKDDVLDSGMLANQRQ